MKISGFTIVRNGNYYAYPYKEAILSVLPLCDEFVVNVGISDDGTLEDIKALGSDKIKIIEREWDMSIRESGRVLSIETNIAKEQCAGDWCFYIQGDEVLHEKFFPVIKEAMDKYLDDDEVEGLRFKYRHFYGSYDYVQDNFRKWYTKETRIIKNKKDILSWGDAMNFKHPDGSGIKEKDIKAEIYHYGWVRPPQVMIQKRADFDKLYHNDEESEKNIARFNQYDDLGNLVRFTDSHPAVMKERVAASKWDFDAQLEKQPPDWIRGILNWLHPVTKRLKKIFP